MFLKRLHTFQSFSFILSIDLVLLYCDGCAIFSLLISLVFNASRVFAVSFDFYTIFWFAFNVYCHSRQILALSFSLSLEIVLCFARARAYTFTSELSSFSPKMHFGELVESNFKPEFAAMFIHHFCLGWWDCIKQTKMIIHIESLHKSSNCYAWRRNKNSSILCVCVDARLSVVVYCAWWQ